MTQVAQILGKAWPHMNPDSRESVVMGLIEWRIEYGQDTSTLQADLLALFTVYRQGDNPFVLQWCGKFDDAKVASTSLEQRHGKEDRLGTAEGEVVEMREEQQAEGEVIRKDDRRDAQGRYRDELANHKKQRENGSQGRRLLR